MEKQTDVKGVRGVNIYNNNKMLKVRHKEIEVFISTPFASGRCHSGGHIPVRHI